MLFFFGSSIFIHEFGHFWIAKKRGLHVPKFSIGFGPSLFSWKRGETTYCISLLPLGGYVALPQMGEIPILEGKSSESLQPLGFIDKTLVAVMGAVFNLLFAFLLACLLWVVGLRTPAQEKTREIGYILPQYEGVETPAAKAGLHKGDEILAIDQVPITSFSEIEKRIILGSGHGKENQPQVTITYRRNGEIRNTTLSLMRIQTNSVSGDQIRFSGIMAPKQDLIVEAFEPGSPAELCGLQKGDRLLQVDEIPLYSVVDLRDYLNQTKPTQVTFFVERNGERFPVLCRTQSKPYQYPWFRYGTSTNFLDVYEENGSVKLLHASGERFATFPQEGKIIACNGMRVHDLQTLSECFQHTTERAIILTIETNGQHKLAVIPNEPYNLTFHPMETVQRVGIAFGQPTVTTHETPFHQFRQAIASTFETLTCLLDRHSDVKMQHLMGAPGIMRLLHRFSIDDFRRLIWFMVILNINLAILNLLPIPVLDGGHIVFAIFEKLRKKPLPQTMVLGVQNLFVMLFLGFMAYVIFFDLRRWQGDLEKEATQQRFEKLQIPTALK